MTKGLLMSKCLYKCIILIKKHELATHLGRYKNKQKSKSRCTVYNKKYRIKFFQGVDLIKIPSYFPLGFANITAVYLKYSFFFLKKF